MGCCRMNTGHLGNGELMAPRSRVDENQGKEMPGSPWQIGISVIMFICSEVSNMSNERQTNHTERRELVRSETTDVWMTCFLELPDGTVVEGVVKNFSLNGAKVVMTSESVEVGDEAKIVFVLAGEEKMQCRCEARHVDRETKTLGLRFMSRPEPVEDIRQNRCASCGKLHPASSSYCPDCGEKLNTRFVIPG